MESWTLDIMTSSVYEIILKTQDMKCSSKFHYFPPWWYRKNKRLMGNSTRWNLHTSQVLKRAHETTSPPEHWIKLNYLGAGECVGTEVVVRNARLLGEASVPAALPCAAGCPTAATHTVPRCRGCCSAPVRSLRSHEDQSIPPCARCCPWEMDV